MPILVLYAVYAWKLVEKALKCTMKNFSILFFYMKNFLYIRV